MINPAEFVSDPAKTVSAELDMVIVLEVVPRLTGPDNVSWLVPDIMKLPATESELVSSLGPFLE